MVKQASSKAIVDAAKVVRTASKKKKRKKEKEIPILTANYCLMPDSCAPSRIHRRSTTALLLHLFPAAVPRQQSTRLRRRMGGMGKQRESKENSVVGTWSRKGRYEGQKRPTVRAN